MSPRVRTFHAFAAVCFAWLPARAAASLDPMRALRHD